MLSLTPTRKPNTSFVPNSGSPYLLLHLRSQDEMIQTIRINLPGMYGYSTSDVVCILNTTYPFQHAFITVIS